MSLGSEKFTCQFARHFTSGDTLQISRFVRYMPLHYSTECGTVGPEG